MQSFTPTLGLRNPHVLTIAGSLVPRGQKIFKNPGTRLLVKVDQHAQISIYCHRQPDYPDRPTLILVHGLEGSADSFYITSLTQNAWAKKCNVVRVNLRSCGGDLHLTPTLYHAGQSEDILKVVDFLKEKKDLNHFFLVGFSLGGNIVLKAATELGNRSVRGVCAIAPSIDLNLCIEALEQGFNKFYTWRFLKSLKQKVLQKHPRVPEYYDLSHLPYIKSLRHFDDAYTAKNAGFRHAAHYYQEASAGPKLKDVTVPTKIIAAQDDPFIPFEQFRGVETEYIKLMSTTYGGHLGFVSIGKELNGWLDAQILRFCLKHS